MEKTYSMAYTEVLEILKYMPIDEFHKIPKEKIEFLKKNKDCNYNYKYNEDNPNISRKAEAILTRFYLDYFATPEEREKIEEILKLNTKKDEDQKIEKYGTEISFKGRTNKQPEEMQNTNVEEMHLIETTNKEKWYKKIWNKILKFLQKKK